MIKFVGTGAIINLIAGGRVVDTLIVAVLGDVNGDGKVLANDARLVLRHVAKLGILPSFKCSRETQTAIRKLRLQTRESSSV